MPDAPQTVSVAAGGTATANIQVLDVRLAFVVDDTGSMSEEIGGVRSILTNLIDALDAIPLVGFPTTALITFKDSIARPVVTNDADTLRTAVNALVASGGGD